MTPPPLGDLVVKLVLDTSEVEPLAISLRDAVRSELATLGSGLLREHGPDAAHPNATLATVGGYLLDRYGDGDAPPEAAA